MSKRKQVASTVAQELKVMRRFESGEIERAMPLCMCIVRISTVVIK